MNITVSATGILKQYIPAKKQIVIPVAITLRDLSRLLGIPEKLTMTYTVNGKISQENSTISDNDEVRLLMIAGGG